MMQESKPYYPDAPRATTFEDGAKYQDFIRWQLQLQRGISISQNVSRTYQFNMGENTQGIEIKFDSLCTKGRRRLSIEIAEKSRASMPEWTPSGIYRTDNTWLYIQGNYEKAYAFSRKLLRWWHARESARGKLELHEEHGTVRAFYMYETDALRCAEFFMELPNEAQQAFHGGWAR